MCTRSLCFCKERFWISFVVDMSARVVFLSFYQLVRLGTIGDPLAVGLYPKQWHSIEMLHNGMTLVPKIRSVPLSPSGVAKDSAQGF